ncbi:MAG: hypothetical protein RL026_1681 [Pseudomonadota bacterium]|jgi:drug/metabolite transporter (DMT)-like permease
MSAAPRGTLLACLAAVYLIWGSSYLATRIGVTHLPPMLFGGLRFAAAGLLLLAFSAWRGFPLADLRRDWRSVLWLGFIGCALVNGLQIWALQWVPSSTGALLNASSALWIVGFGLFGARAERPSPWVWCGLVAGAVGTVLLVLPEGGAGDVGAGVPLLPQLAILLACLFWAVATQHLRDAPPRLDIITLTGGQMLAGGLMMTAAGLAAGEHHAWHSSREGLLAMAWLTVFSGCLAYTAYGWLARHASPALVSTYSYVNPAIATLLGFLVLGERLQPLQWLGTAVILAAVLLVSLPAAAGRARPTPSDA